MEEGLGTPIITSDNSLNLDSIPPELVLLILQNLTIPDIQNFCNSTRRHRNLCSSDNGFRMIMQQKIEEFKPVLIEMSYQDLMETCRMYHILQEFCETDDAFWDTKFRLDFADTIDGLLEDQEDFYLDGACKSIYQLLNKEAYEEFMRWDNFMLLEEDRPDVFIFSLVLGRYLKDDLPEYIKISLQHLDSPDYRRILEYIVNEIGFPVSPEFIESVEMFY